VIAVEQLAPGTGPADLEEILVAMAATPSRAPFDELSLEFGDALSRRLFREPTARQHPELLVLAYWLRRASLVRLREAFLAEQGSGASLVPRGLVFHVPPTNVDTMAIYSLALSLFVGNHNLVRISPQRSPQADILSSALRDVLAEERFAPLRTGNVLVSYGHQVEPTAAATAVCDVRVVWGGDATVERLREIVLPAQATEIAFPDRFSFAVASPEAWLEADADERVQVTKGLYDDSYWFDQMGCASPRLLVWCGDEAAAQEASDQLFEQLAELVRERGYELEAGAVAAKETYLYGAVIDRPVTRVRRFANELAVLTLESLEGFDRTHPGAGLFFETVVPDVTELAPFVVRKDQTMTVYGLEDGPLGDFVTSANGRGVDRIVPFGQALAFDREWDGMDLLAELTRRVVLAPAAGQAPARTGG
jgi:hypothetical protein